MGACESRGCTSSRNKFQPKDLLANDRIEDQPLILQKANVDSVTNYQEPGAQDINVSQQLSSAKSEISSLQAEKEKNEQLLKNLQQQLKDINQSNLNEQKSLRDEINQLTEKVNSAKERVKQLEDQCSKCIKEKEEINAQLELTKKQLSESEKTIASQSEQISQLKQALESNKINVVDDSKAKSQVDDGKAKSQAALEQLEKEKQIAIEANKALEAKLALLQKERESSDSRYKQLLESAEAAKLALEQQNKELLAQLEKLKIDLEALGEKRKGDQEAQGEKRKGDQEGHMEKLKNDLEQMEKLKNDLEGQIEKLKSDLEARHDALYRLAVQREYEIYNQERDQYIGLSFRIGVHTNTTFRKLRLTMKQDNKENVFDSNHLQNPIEFKSQEKDKRGKNKKAENAKYFRLFDIPTEHFKNIKLWPTQIIELINMHAFTAMVVVAGIVPPSTASTPAGSPMRGSVSGEGKVFQLSPSTPIPSSASSAASSAASSSPTLSPLSPSSPSSPSSPTKPSKEITDNLCKLKDIKFDQFATEKLQKEMLENLQSILAQIGKALKHIPVILYVDSRDSLQSYFSLTDAAATALYSLLATNIKTMITKANSKIKAIEVLDLGEKGYIEPETLWQGWFDIATTTSLKKGYGARPIQVGDVH